MPRAQVLTLLLLAAGCGRAALVHGADEGQANQILVALDEAGIQAEKQRDEGGEGTWRVEVDRSDSGRAHRVLAERELPRSRPPGFSEVFGKGSMVPTPTEERALYLHALSGELARSVEAIDGVTEARVHLALPAQDPLRAEPAPPGRGAVLVKARAGARPRLEALAPGIQSLVAGAVAGLEAGAVSVVVAEAAPPAPREAMRAGRRSLLVTAAAIAAALALALAASPLVGKLATAGLRSARRSG
ncbi:MAG TPA: secretion protein [Anaeromyxobacteraceae bacterium]|nr:secretion protein [Anaeromyxobacteraceae bacterium]